MEKNERLERIRERISVKKVHGLDSESEGEPEIKKEERIAELSIYNTIKQRYQAELDKLEAAIVKYRAENGGKIPQEA